MDALRCQESRFILNSGGHWEPVKVCVGLMCSCLQTLIRILAQFKMTVMCKSIGTSGLVILSKLLTSMFILQSLWDNMETVNHVTPSLSVMFMNSV